MPLPLLAVAAIGFAGLKAVNAYGEAGKQEMFARHAKFHEKKARAKARSRQLISQRQKLRQQQRQQRVIQARLQAQSAGANISGSSGLQAAQGSLNGRVAANLATTFGDQNLVDSINASRQDAADVRSEAAASAAKSQQTDAILGFAGDVTQVGLPLIGGGSGGGAPDTSDILGNLP